MTRLDKDVVANSKLCLDMLGCAKSDDFTMRHDADTVSQFISFFDMLCTHNDRATLFECPDELPDLLTRFDIKTRGRFIKDNRLSAANKGHSER